MGRIRNLDKLQKRLRSISSPKATKLVEGALFASAGLIATEAQISITRGSASGTSGGKHQHIPSAPGDPPNNFTGHLAGQIGVYPTASKTISGLEVIVVSAAEYSDALEFSTSKMEARPFFRPARDKNKKAAKKLFRDAVAKIVKGAAE